MNHEKTIGLWLDNTSDPSNPRWIVSRDTDGSSYTVAAFIQGDYDDALSLAKSECQRTGYPVVKTDEHGNRETIYEISSNVYYAVCDVNGPISRRIEAGSVEDAVKYFESANTRNWIDNASTDAEDDLEIDGSGMSEDEFADALESAGCELVQDLAEVHSNPSSPVQHAYHVVGGWRLWLSTVGPSDKSSRTNAPPSAPARAGAVNAAFPQGARLANQPTGKGIR